MNFIISVLNKMPLQGWRVYIVNVAIIVAASVSIVFGADITSAGSAIAFALSGLFMRHTLSKSATQVGYTNALLEQLLQELGAAERDRRAQEEGGKSQ